SGEFTRAAQAAAAKEPRVQLIDGAALRHMLGARVDAFVPSQSNDANFGDLDTLKNASISPVGYRPRSTRYRRKRNPLPGMAFAVITALMAFYFIRHVITDLAMKTSAPPSAFIPTVPPAMPSLVSPMALPAKQIQQASYEQTQMTEAELREWKRKNAESMKILEKTTPEMPLR
ncbi:MAG TPA: hypothetical protein VGV14_18185, partial [Rhodanobacter sp.]|nr:hypothetical protein [Rhodanobacter sp.]